MGCEGGAAIEDGGDDSDAAGDAVTQDEGGAVIEDGSGLPVMCGW